MSSKLTHRTRRVREHSPEPGDDNQATVDALPAPLATAGASGLAAVFFAATFLVAAFFVASFLAGTVFVVVALDSVATFLTASFLRSHLLRDALFGSRLLRQCRF